MNKFIRAMLITFAVCLVVGGGLLIAGIALGGTWNDATVVIGDDEYDARDMFDHGLLKFEGRTDDAGDSDTPETVSATNELIVDASDIRDLEIVLRNCELQILPADNDQICVTVENEMEKYFSLMQDEDEIQIIDIRKNKSNLKTISVSLRIPADHVFDEVSMELGAGNIQIDRLAANDISIEGGAGTLKAETLIAKNELDADLGAGDFYFAEAVLGETDIDCGVGKLEIENCTLDGDADISGGVGDVNIGIVGEKEDFNYVLSCGMGELNVFGDSYTSLGKEKDINNGARYTISLECGVGKVNVYQAGES